MSRVECERNLNSKASQIDVHSDGSRTPPPLQRPPAWFRFLAPSASDLIFIILLVTMTAGVLAPRLLGDASIGWHIRNGELMLQSHSITRTDPFSVTMAGRTWYAWEWLYDAGIAAVHHQFGLNGVVLFTAVLALSLGASTIHLFARPHVLSWLLSVIWFQLLDSSKENRLWWLPALMLLWVNVHGGFVLGFALLGLYLLSSTIRYFRCRLEDMHRNIAQPLRRLALLTVASLLVSLINPYGYKLHVHVYRYLSSRWLMNHIDEFLSPNFHGVAQQCFVIILLITIVTVALAGNKPPLSQVFVLLFAAYSGLYASRSLPVSSLLLTMIVAPLLTGTISDAHANPELSSSLQTFFLRWESFTSRMGALNYIPADTFGRWRLQSWAYCCVGSREGWVHRNGWMRISMPNIFLYRQPNSLRSAIFAIRSLLLIRGVDILSTGSILRPKCLWTTATISTEKSSLKII